jgi:NTE family protein
VPWLFKPVTIAGREYVDGGVWSPTNIDAAPAARDAQVLCLSPTAGAVGPNVWGALRAAGRTAAGVEAAQLRSRGARVRIIGPDAGAAEAMGEDFMSSGPVAEVLAAGFRQGRALGAQYG